MKSKSALPVLVLGSLLAALSTPVLADTAGTSQAQTCPLVGPLDGATEQCRAFRAAYQAALAVCMDQMQQEADARAGRTTKVNSHINKARLFTCDEATREQLGLVKK